MHPTPASPSNTRLTRPPARALFALFLALALCHLSWMSRYPSIRSDLGLSLSDMSLYLTALAVGSAIGLLLSGPVLRVAGYVRVLWWGIPGMGISFMASVILLYCPTPQLALMTLPLYGIAFSVSDVAGTVAGAAIERASGVSHMSRFYAAFSVGSLTALILGALAEAADIPPLLHLLTTAGALLIVGAIALPALSRFAAAWTPPPHPELDTPRDASASRAHPRSITARVIALGAIGACVAIAESAANNWIPLALIDAHGVPGGVGVLALALVVSGSILIRLTGDRLVGRLGRVAALRFTLALGVAGVLTVILSPVLWLTFVGVALWGVGIGLTGPVALSAAADDPRFAAQRVASVSVVTYAGYLLSPALFGVLGEATGFPAAFLPLAAFLAVGAALAGVAKPLGRRTA